MRIAWHSLYKHPLPDAHRFPMIKYDLIREQLIYEGIAGAASFITPQAMSLEAIQTVHEADYVRKLEDLTLSPAEIRATGFPLSKELVLRERIIMQGTWEAAQAAITTGVGLNIAGGTHHAFANRGEGFCLFNDQAIAAQLLLNAGLSSKVLIIDLDVHQGNGTASIFAGRKDVFTFSMHGAKNYPLHKMKSHLDIALEDGTDDETYLRLLRENLDLIMHQFQPDFIFYQSGVDVLESDALGRLSLTLDGCKQRDQFVLKTAYHHKIPLCISMGGGYSKDIRLILEAHCNTFRLAAMIYG